MKKVNFSILFLALVLIISGCSSNEFKTVDADREKAIQITILDQPGGDKIPELYLDVAYELVRIAASDWMANGSPSGQSLNWTYLDANGSILGASSIALKVTYPDGWEPVYSILVYR